MKGYALAIAIIVGLFVLLLLSWVWSKLHSETVGEVEQDKHSQLLRELRGK